METPRLLINPVLQWAIEPSHHGSIKYIDGLAQGPATVPLEGDVLTLPFMVDPVTLLPCPVRVLRLAYQDGPLQTVVIPVVVRHRPT